MLTSAVTGLVAAAMAFASPAPGYYAPTKPSHARDGQGTGGVGACPAGSLVTAVKTRKKVVALTFDDGPSDQTLQFAKVLHKYDAPATFFQVGINLKGREGVTRRLIRMGFDIGNHSMSHSYTGSTLAAQIPTMNKYLQRTTGQWPLFYRSPGLERSPEIQRALAESGQCNIMTDRDLEDWRAPRHSAAAVCQAFNRSLHPGFIALMHDGTGHTQTLSALPCILKTAQRRGYRVERLDEMLLMGEPVTSGSERITADAPGPLQP